MAMVPNGATQLKVIRKILNMSAVATIENVVSICAINVLSNFELMKVFFIFAILCSKIAVGNVPDHAPFE